MERRTLVADHLGLASRTVNGVSLERLKFSIMHGNGNVILVLDEPLSGLAPWQVDGTLGREICQSIQAVRVGGIAFGRLGGDQVTMRYFERDGTHSQMCGNALRCVTRYSRERGYIPSETFIATDE